MTCPVARSIVVLLFLVAACGGARQQSSRPWSEDLVPEDDRSTSAGVGESDNSDSEELASSTGEGAEADGSNGGDVEGVGSSTPDSLLLTLETAGARVCRVEAESIVETHEGRRLPGLTMGFGSTSGLLAWARDGSSVALVPLSASGQPSGFTRTESMPLATGLEKIISLGESFLLITQDVCDSRLGKLRTDRCVHARAFSATGAPRGAATEGLNTFGGAIIDQIEVRDDAALLAWAQRRKGHFLYRFRLTQSGDVEVEELDMIKSVVWQTGNPIRSYHCGIEGERLSVLEEDSENERWSLLRTSADGGVARVTISGLESGITPLSCTTDEGGISIIYFRQGSPLRLFARFDASGAPRAEPRPLERGARPPAPFTSRLEVAVYTDRPRGESVPWPVRVQRRLEATDQEIGEVTSFGRARSPFMTGPDGAWTWTGERLLVAYGEQENERWQIHTGRIDCRPRASE